MYDQLTYSDKITTQCEYVNVNYVIDEGGTKKIISDWYGYDMYLIFGQIDAAQHQGQWERWQNR